MYAMHEELARAYLTEQRAEAAHLRLIPRRPFSLRLRGRFATTLRRLADRLEPA